MRQQNVPLPHWMRDYRPSACPVPATTPALVAEAEKRQGRQILRRRLYGGVTLSVPDDKLRITEASATADALAPALRKAVAGTSSLTPVAFEHGGKRFRAVALPGGAAEAVGACRLDEVDLTVPLQGDTELRLTRHFHSFFRPSGELGEAWTLDLPYLARERRPLRRTSEKVEFRVTHRLGSPLNSCSETFAEQKFVPELNARLPAPAGSGPYLGLASLRLDLVGFNTTVVFLRDGRRWHFDDAGNLVAEESLPFSTVYRRDGAGRILAIEGYLNKEKRGEVRLEHDATGRISSARGTNGAAVTYEYDAARLVCVQSKHRPALGYQYRDGQVTAVSQDGRVVQGFEYTGGGRIKKEMKPDGTELTYEVTAGPERTRIVARSHRRSALVGTEAAEYDGAMRPLSLVLAGGAKLEWVQRKGYGLEVTLTLPGGDQYRFEQAANGRDEIWHQPGGGTYRVLQDETGRLTALFAGDRPVWLQEWRSDGRLALAANETTALRPGYHSNGVLKELLVAPAGKAGAFSRWLKVQCDERGNVVKIADQSGELASVTRDHAGQTTGWKTVQGELRRERDDQRRVKTVRTSWGVRQDFTFDPKDGSLQKAEFAHGDAKAFAEFVQGKLTLWRLLDGGKYLVNYFDRGPQEGQAREIEAPNGLVLKYDYDSGRRVESVTCGDAYRLEYAFDDQGRLVQVTQVPLRE